MNDVNANPINIAAVVVWRVYDAAEAMFEVEKYQHYVQIQSEAALREMATKYPYDAIEEKDIGGITLSGHQDVIAKELQASVERVFLEPVSPCLRPASATSLIPRKSLKRCFAVNRPVPWSLHDERSLTVPWAWLNSHLNNSVKSKSSTSTRTKKRPW